MEDFDKVDWEEKWDFASKFKDPRLQFFAARHIYRNTPDFLPKNIFRRVHQKISERFNSMKKEKGLRLKRGIRFRVISKWMIY